MNKGFFLMRVHPDEEYEIHVEQSDDNLFLVIKNVKTLVRNVVYQVQVYTDQQESKNKNRK